MNFLEKALNKLALANELAQLQLLACCMRTGTSRANSLAFKRRKCVASMFPLFYKYMKSVGKGWVAAIITGHVVVVGPDTITQ